MVGVNINQESALSSSDLSMSFFNGVYLNYSLFANPPSIASFIGS